MQQLFIAIGAYAAIFLLFIQVPFVVCIPLAGAAAAMIALATGIPLIRLRGAPFSVGTIAVSNFMMYLFINTKELGGSLGIQLPLPPYPDKVPFYYMSMLIGVVAAYVFHALKPSKFGIAVASIRENEMAAESLGLNPAKYKLLALIIGAGFTGMAGCLYAYYNTYIEPISIFSFDWMLAIIVITIVGGVGEDWGSIVGATIYLFLSEFLFFHFSSSHLLVGGLFLLILIKIYPKGLTNLILKGVSRLRSSI